MVRPRDAATELLGHRLHAVADAEYRHAEREHRVGRTRRRFGGDGFRAAGEDDPACAEGADNPVVDVPGKNLAVDTEFSHPAGDQLGVLGTEVEDQNPVRVDVSARGGLVGAVPARAVS